MVSQYFAKRDAPGQKRHKYKNNLTGNLDPYSISQLNLY